MAILKIRDENGVVHEILAIKGDKGEKGEKGDDGEVPITVSTEELVDGESPLAPGTFHFVI